MSIDPAEFTARISGGLIVSCQAYPGEAMRDPNTMAQVARAAVTGGAVGIRLQGIDDIRAAADLDVPVIGLWKDGADGVFITPTLEHARAVADAGAEVVALDGTRRPRPDGLTLAETIAALRETHDVLVMADCGSLDDAIAAEAAGADLLGTTLAGYTGERPKTPGPDLELVEQVAAHCTRPVIAEGRIHTPADAAAAVAAGATAVCVGTAITHPSSITSWFVAALPEAVAR
ncbi:N-acetylmannosamine-6-phosphate 2-epimerase [Agromyces sp. NPDC058484]|uniref:N-acetylmannosamine-6-phosphate 2-epimerase n=1 Tax=Agromyces sp. NPDC058484 TaxID=3346524 RepID=UPI003655D954